MRTTILNLSISIIGLLLTANGLKHWHGKLTDIRILPEFTLNNLPIIEDTIYGIGLIFLSYLSYRKSKITTDLSIILLSFPIFSDLSFFFSNGLIIWILGISILLSNLTLLYKLVTIVIYNITFNFWNSFSFYNLIFYTSILLLTILLIDQFNPMKKITGYKMPKKSKWMFAVWFLPIIISEFLHQLNIHL